VRRWVAFALLPLLSACGSAPVAAVSTASPPVVERAVPPSDAAPTAPSASSSGSTPLAAPRTRTRHAADFVVGGTRPVTVHVPQSVDGDRPAPLVIALHGSASSGRGVDAYLHLGAAAAARGILVAEPDGTSDAAGRRFWDATDACCDFDHSAVDDSGYLRGVIGAIQAETWVDPKRIFVVGFSNGGFMGYRLACDQADIIAAVVSLSGATFATAGRCRPSEPVSILEIHGTADRSVAYRGGRIAVGSPASRRPASYPGARTTASIWARYDGCGATSVTLPGRVDVDAAIAVSSGPAEAIRQAWQSCRPGGAVELWTVPGGGHAPTISATFPDAALDFLLSHPKP